MEWVYGEDNDFGNFFETLTDSLSPSIETVRDIVVNPFEIRLSYFSKAEKKLFTRFDAIYRHRPDLLPEVFGRLNYKLDEKAVVWIHAGAGGASRTNVGLGSQVQIGSKSFLQIGSNHFLGLVSKYATSTSLFINLMIGI